MIARDGELRYREGKLVVMPRTRAAVPARPLNISITRPPAP
jgi:hypothetical protein